VNVARKMGIRTIAEFVENEEVLKVVEDLGIDYA
jgi:EAL domain-containing protein (putative c-di-GMP-specific phosphodiesterase class I)